MNIALSGATGFVGTYLQSFFSEKGWSTLPLLCSDFNGDGNALHAKFSQARAVVNLAGSPIAARWTESYTQEFYSSRIPVTEKIVAAMAGLDKNLLCLFPPQAREFISPVDPGRRTMPPALMIFLAGSRRAGNARHCVPVSLA